MKSPNPPNTVTIAILTTITIVFWIFYSVYQILGSTPPVDIPSQILDPVDPSLDIQTLNELPSKIYFEKNEFAQLPKIITLPENENLENLDDDNVADDIPANPDDESIEEINKEVESDSNSVPVVSEENPKNDQN